MDRAHDKEPLRPAEAAVMKDWFACHCEQKVVIVKLHTGQGKVLISLLMLHPAQQRQGADRIADDSYRSKQPLRAQG